MQRTTELFVPGRVCLFGEHSDWAGAYRTENPAIKPGCTIICGTNSGIYARVRAHPEKLLLHSIIDGQHTSADLPMHPDVLLGDSTGGRPLVLYSRRCLSDPEAFSELVVWK